MTLAVCLSVSGLMWIVAAVLQRPFDRRIRDASSALDSPPGDIDSDGGAVVAHPLRGGSGSSAVTQDKVPAEHLSPIPEEEQDHVHEMVRAPPNSSSNDSKYAGEVQSI